VARPVSSTCELHTDSRSCLAAKGDGEAGLSLNRSHRSLADPRRVS
jgi:hypothetical protein